MRIGSRASSLAPRAYCAAQNSYYHPPMAADRKPQSAKSTSDGARMPRAEMAIGIALLATLLDARTKVYFDYLREAVVPSNPQVAERLAQLAERLGNDNAALGKLSEITHQQALIMAYNDAFHFVGIGLAVSMVAVLLTRKLPEGLKAGEAH